MPSIPWLLACSLLLGAGAGWLLACSLTFAAPPEAASGAASSASPAESKARSHKTVFFFGAMALGFVAFVVGFIAWNGMGVFAPTPPGATRADDVNSLSSPGLLWVAGAYVLGLLNGVAFRYLNARIRPGH